MKNYEVYSRNFSQVVQEETIAGAILKFVFDNPKEEIITVENIEARNESPSPLSGEEIKPFDSVTTAGDLPDAETIINILDKYDEAKWGQSRRVPKEEIRQWYKETFSSGEQQQLKNQEVEPGQQNSNQRIVEGL